MMGMLPGKIQYAEGMLAILFLFFFLIFTDLL